MTLNNRVAKEVISQARSFGASLAGITPLGPVLESPSTRVHRELRLDHDSGSLLVLGLSHPDSDPHLDYWGGSRGTEGNRFLHETMVRMVRWLRDQHRITARPLPYQVKHGGVYLKDAAVLAGLGVIGRNNLVIAPGLGPRVRFSALWMEAEAQPPDPCEFDPCRKCPALCLTTCPQQAFDANGFSRPSCMVQMHSDEDKAWDNGQDLVSLIAYCRKCELACRVEVEGVS